MSKPDVYCSRWTGALRTFKSDTMPHGPVWQDTGTHKVPGVHLMLHYGVAGSGQAHAQCKAGGDMYRVYFEGGGCVP